MRRTQIGIGIVTCAFLGIASSASAGSITGTIHAAGLRNVADAVVYIEKIEGKTFPVPKEPAIMDQNARVFIPKILPVLVGTTVEFLNSDPFAHNVFTPDECADEFDLGTWETGGKRSYTFDKSCVAVMLCNLHQDMAAYVVVVETPYFTITDTTGEFTIENVPDGTYTVSAWHERMEKKSREVVVSGATKLDLTLTIRQSR
ncbi:MAG: hypothetical protein BMS9Abin37_0512 [Acidobacteriota bacterium]|nr:MAG: hypothetical protein BMS9Abin37_0512 [Acidobacteriota bacterium]